MIRRNLFTKIVRQQKCHPSVDCGLAPARSVGQTHWLQAGRSTQLKKKARFFSVVEIQDEYLLPLTNKQTRKRLYHSSALGGMENGEADRKLLQMVQKQVVNSQAIDKMFDSIEKKTNISLNEETFHLMVQNCIQRVSGDVDVSPKVAESFVFKWMIRFHEQDRLDKPPSSKTLGLVLQAWARSGEPESGRMAEELLDKIGDLVQQGTLPFTVDIPLYTIVMKAYAIQGDFQNALRILDRSIADFEQGNEGARPGIRTWNLLLNTCAKSGMSNSWEIAEEILQKMNACNQSGILLEGPFNKASYSCLIESCTKSNQPERAQFWLEEMFNDYQRGNRVAQPNLFCFNSVLEAWTQPGTAEGADKSEIILKHLIQLGNEGALPVRPSTLSYNTVISAFAKSKQPQRAEHWLEELFKDFQNGNQLAEPDVQSFNVVLDAWARLGTAESSERCGKLLHHMIRLSKEGKIPIEPDSLSYNTVINACAACGQPQSAEAWLEEMIKDFQSWNSSAEPDVQSYNAVLDAWARLGTVEGAEQCKQILNDMIKQRKKGDFPVRPNSTSYEHAITACAKSNQPQIAEFWLEELLKQFEGGNSSAQPNANSFNLVLEAWASLGTVKGAEQCEKILNRLGNLNKGQTPFAASDSMSYRTFMQACANSDPEIFGEILDQMNIEIKENKLPVRPNTASYNSTIKAWATLGKAKKARQIFDRMLDHYKDGKETAKPDMTSCKSLLRAFINSELPDAGERADAFLEEMQKLELNPDQSTYVLVILCWECALVHGHKGATDRIKEVETFINSLECWWHLVPGCSQND